MMRKIILILMVCFIVIGVTGISGCIGGDQVNNQANNSNQSSNDNSNGNSGSNDNAGRNQGQNNVNI